MTPSTVAGPWSFLCTDRFIEIGQQFITTNKPDDDASQSLRAKYNDQRSKHEAAFSSSIALAHPS